MKKLLIITEEYYPYVSANVNCVSKIIKGFQEKNYSVSVLTISYEVKLSEFEKINGCSVYRMPFWEPDIVYRLLTKYKALNNKLIRIFLGAIGKYTYCFDRKKKIRHQKNLFADLRNKNFDYVISFVNPIGAHEIAYNFIDENTKWIMYNLDAYAFNYTFRNSIKKRMNEEINWSKKARGVINSVGIVEENEKHNYFPYKNIKQLEVPLPNLEITEHKTYQRNDSRKIIMRYTGVFYSDIRRPDELMKILCELNPDIFEVEFFGSCCEYINDNFEKIPPCLKLKGSVSIEECRSLVDSSDILINVGNLCTNQIPSKVFEYIETGKPILNIYLTDNDPCLSYFKKYPNCININKSEQITSDDLIKLSQTTIVGASSLREIYKDELMENVINKIVNFVESI